MFTNLQIVTLQSFYRSRKITTIFCLLLFRHTLFPRCFSGFKVDAGVSNTSLEPLLSVDVPFRCLIWPPIVMGRSLYFTPVVSIIFFSFSSFFFSWPNLSGRRLDVYHTSTHDVALV